MGKSGASSTSVTAENGLQASPLARDVYRGAKRLPRFRWILLACIAVVGVLFTGPTLVEHLTKVRGPSAIAARASHVTSQSISSSPPATPVVFVTPELPIVIDNVFVADLIWIPHEFRFVIISFAPHYFRYREVDGKKVTRYETHAYNHTFESESLEHPTTLKLWVEGYGPVTCNTSATLSGDWNLDDTLSIASCGLDRKPRNWVVVGTGNRTIGVMTMKKLNALQTYEFQRPEPKGPPTGGVAVIVKSFLGISPFVHDMIRFFKLEGYSHVYLGLHLRNDPHLLSKMRALLADFEGFVSYGTIKSHHVSFADLAGTQKMPWINAAFFHAKSFDRLATVHDIDEAIVSMNPGVRAADALLSAVPPDSKLCYLELSSNSLESRKNKSPNATLDEAFPTRCQGGYANYSKSVAITKNAQYVGFHIHDSSCGERAPLSSKIATVHHYVSFWSPRGHENPNCDVPSELAKVLAHNK